MIEYNLRLNNFFGYEFSQPKMENILSVKRFSINMSGKFYEIDPICPRCNSTRIVHNGNDVYRNKIINELGLIIKKGKFLCNMCDHTWTIHCEEVELFVHQYKQMIRTAIFELCTFDVSLDKVVEHISTTFSRNISHEWIRQSYINAARKIEQKKVLKTSGIFHYDEQYLKVNNKEQIRIVVIDAVTKQVIFDNILDNSRIETLKDELKMKMLPYRKEAFIVDLALGYPKMLKDLYPKVKIQFCLFHLNKLILKDFEDSKKLNKYGRKELPLQEVYNMYLLLNLFFNHEVELRFLRRQLKKLSENEFTQEEGLISFYEIKLISDFNEFRNSLKKNRRKHIKYLLRNSKEETLNLLARLERELSLFTKKSQKRIKMIRKNINYLTLFQDNVLVSPTNNTLEQYYSATLQKTEKKKFRCSESLHLKLKIARERWNKTLGNLKFNFLDFLQLFAKIHYLFGST